MSLLHNPPGAHCFSALLPFVLSLPTLCPRAGTSSGLTAPCLATRSPEGPPEHTAAGPQSGSPPGTREAGTELHPAHLPPGRPQTNKYLQTSGKAPNKLRAPAGCPLPGGPAGLGVPLPPGSQPRDRRAEGADKEENQFNHFLGFHLDFTGPPARLCTQIYVALKRLRSKTPTKQTGQPGPTTSPLPPNSLRVCCGLGCLSAWKKERRGSLRSIYIHIFSIKTIK